MSISITAPLRASGDRRQHHFRRRHGEIRPMVLADPEGVDAQFVRQHALVDDVADGLGVRAQLAIRADGDVAKGIQSEFKILGHSLSCELKSAAQAGGGMGAPVMFQEVGCGGHRCNAGAGGRARPVFGQGGAQTGPILPAASCNSPNPPFGLISGRERGQIAQ
jgi:hypothetical protein